MKKTLLLLILLALCLFSGCGGESAAPADPAPETAESAEPAPETAESAKPAAPLPYEGNATGNADLDAQMLAVLEEVYDPAASEEDNLAAVYRWVCDGITYRAGTVDVSGGFTEELTEQLALEGLQKRKGNCDTEAAVMAALLERLGYPCQILQGQFLREDGQWVDHAWVLAEVDGAPLHFDPLYGRYYAEDPMDSFLQPDSALEGTHRWDAAGMNGAE